MYETKRQMVEDAFGEIGIASYVFDLKPGMLERALRKMDAIVAQWESKGVRINYPLTSSPDLDDEVDIPDWTANAIVLNTAVAIAPGHGKTISQDTRSEAKRARNAVFAKVAVVPEMTPSALPAGQGNKPYKGASNQFIPAPSTDFPTDDAGGPVL